MISLSEVETELRVRANAAEEEDLDIYVHSACHYYSQFNPNVIEDVLPLISGLNAYDLPYGVIGVRRIDWWPYGKKEVAPDLLNYPDLLFHDDSKYFFKPRQSLDLFRCRWLVEGDTLLLFPTPTKDEEVKIIWTTPHEFNPSSGVYETIPDSDLPIIVALSLAEYLETRRLQAAMLPDFSEGMTSITRRYMTNNLERMIESLRAQVRLKYGS